MTVVENKGVSYLSILSKLYKVLYIAFLLFILGLFSIIGGVIFERVESAEETKNIKLIERKREAKINAIYELLKDNKPDRDTKILAEIEVYEDDYIIAVQNGAVLQEGKPSPLWTFSGSVYFCVTTFTLLGYGNVAPRTSVGKIITLIYVAFSVPVSTIVLTDLAASLLSCLEFFGAGLKWSFSSMRNYYRNRKLYKEKKAKKLAEIERRKKMADKIRRLKARSNKSAKRPTARSNKSNKSNTVKSAKDVQSSKSVAKSGGGSKKGTERGDASNASEKNENNNYYPNSGNSNIAADTESKSQKRRLKNVSSINDKNNSTKILKIFNSRTINNTSDYLSISNNLDLGIKKCSYFDSFDKDFETESEFNRTRPATKFEKLQVFGKLLLLIRPFGCFYMGNNLADYFNSLKQEIDKPTYKMRTKTGPGSNTYLKRNYTQTHSNNAGFESNINKKMTSKNNSGNVFSLSNNTEHGSSPLLNKRINREIGVSYEMNRSNNAEDQVYIDINLDDNDDVSEYSTEVVDEEVVPLFFSFIILLVYVIIGSIVSTLWETWSVFDACWFFFISMITIGYGDLVPKNQEAFVYMLPYIFIGMCLVNNLISSTTNFFNKNIARTKKITQALDNISSQEKRMIEEANKREKSRNLWRLLRGRVKEGTIPERLIDESQAYKESILAKEVFWVKRALKLYYEGRELEEGQFMDEEEEDLQAIETDSRVRVPLSSPPSLTRMNRYYIKTKLWRRVRRNANRGIRRILRRSYIPPRLPRYELVRVVPREIVAMERQNRSVESPTP